MLKVKFLELPRTVPPCSELKFLDLPPTVSPCPCVNSTLPTSYNRPWMPPPRPPLRDHNRPLKKSNFFPLSARSATFLHPSPLGRPPSTQSLSRSARSETRSNKFEISKSFAPRFQQIRGLEFGCSSIPRNPRSRNPLRLGSNKLELGCPSISTNSRSRNLLLLDSVLKLSEWRLPPGHPIPTVPKTLVVTGRAD